MIKTANYLVLIAVASLSVLGAEPTFGELPPYEGQEVEQRTFHVVDARTHQPVERFGLAIDLRTEEDRDVDEEGHWLDSLSEPAIENANVPITDHAGGRAVLPAESALHAYRIQAPGYAPQRRPVAYEGGRRDDRQTIRLEPEARIRGRVSYRGAFVPNARVDILRDSFRPSFWDHEEDSDWDGSDGYHDLDAFTGRRRSVRTDAEGKFEIGELANGTYRVEVWVPNTAPYARTGIRALSEFERSIGELQLAEGGTVRGHVDLGPGASPAGLQVLIGSGWAKRECMTDEKGAFECRNIRAGDRSLVVKDIEGLVRGMRPLSTVVREGESRCVFLGLAQYYPAPVRVSVFDWDGPIRDGQLDLGAQRHAPITWPTRHRRAHGPFVHLDARGEVLTTITRAEGIAFDVLSLRGLLLGSLEPTPVFDLAAENVVELTLIAGYLRVEFRDGFEIPSNWSVRLLIDPEGGQPVFRQTVFFHGSQAHPRGRFSGPSRPGEALEVGSIHPGRYVIYARFESFDDDGEGGSWSEKKLCYSGSVEVDSRGVSVCRLRRR